MDVKMYPIKGMAVNQITKLKYEQDEICYI